MNEDKHALIFSTNQHFSILQPNISSSMVEIALYDQQQVAVISNLHQYTLVETKKQVC